MKTLLEGARSFQAARGAKHCIVHCDNEGFKDFVTTLAKLTLEMYSRIMWHDVVEICAKIPGGFDVLSEVICSMASDPSSSFTWAKAARVSLLMRRFREGADLGK